MKKQAVVNWFMSSCRAAMLKSAEFNMREVTRTDMQYWGDFQNRMTQIAADIGSYYKAYDITRRSPTGKWYFDAVRFYSWARANMDIIQRVPDFKPLWDAMVSCAETTRRVSEIECDAGTMPAHVQREAQKIMAESYRQMEMNLYPDAEMTPCNNMGVKTN